MRRLLTLLVVTALGLSLAASNPEGSQAPWSWHLDWAQGKLLLTFQVPLDQEGAALPAARMKAENQAQSALVTAGTQALLSLPAAGASTLKDLLGKDSAFLERLTAAAQAGVQTYSRADEDFRILEVQYSYNLYPDLYALASQALDPDLRPPAPLALRPPMDYTGLVIWAQGPLPFYSQKDQGHLSRALFPRIWDSNGELIFDPGMMDPGKRNLWGPMVYAQEPRAELENRQRLGEIQGNRIRIQPLRLVARGLMPVSGQKTSPDLVVDAKEIKALTSTPAGRRVLTEGKILVILDPEAPKNDVDAKEKNH